MYTYESKLNLVPVTDTTIVGGLSLKLLIKIYRPALGAHIFYVYNFKANVCTIPTKYNIYAMLIKTIFYSLFHILYYFFVYFIGIASFNLDFVIRLQTFLTSIWLFIFLFFSYVYRKINSDYLRLTADGNALVDFH